MVSSESLLPALDWSVVKVEYGTGVVLDLGDVVHSLAVTDEEESHRALGESVVRREREKMAGSVAPNFFNATLS